MCRSDGQCGGSFLFVEFVKKALPKIGNSSFLFLITETARSFLNIKFCGRTAVLDYMANL